MSSVHEKLGGYSEHQRAQFEFPVRKDDHIFAKNSSDQGKSDLLEYEIQTGGSNPIPNKATPFFVFHTISEKLLIRIGRTAI